MFGTNNRQRWRTPPSRFTIPYRDISANRFADDPSNFNVPESGVEGACTPADQRLRPSEFPKIAQSEAAAKFATPPSSPRFSPNEVRPRVAAGMVEPGFPQPAAAPWVLFGVTDSTLDISTRARVRIRESVGAFRAGT